jgi:hypothetical protein
MRRLLLAAAPALLLALAACGDVTPTTAACGACGTNATCTRNATTGVSACQCQTGFTGDGKTCRKTLDPAACGGLCAAEASCQAKSATDATPTCKCKAGFLGDGKSCHKPADCGEAHGGCHHWATCDVDGSGPRCTCAFGTEGDGYVCLPPAGGYVDVKGRLEVNYRAGSSTCNAVWEFDVPLENDGTHYTGHQATNIWDVTSTADVVDFETGATHVKLDVHVWQKVNACQGDFQLSTTQNGALTWMEVPGSFPLVVLGDVENWSWATTNGMPITSFAGKTEVVFHAP